MPVWNLTIKGLAKILDQEKIMAAEERNEMESLLEKAGAFLKCQGVGLSSSKQSFGRFSVTESDR